LKRWGVDDTSHFFSGNPLQFFSVSAALTQQKTYNKKNIFFVFSVYIFFYGFSVFVAH
jgi:hypothetical protein